MLESLFQNHYNDWREKRIKKIENLLSVNFIKNKSILEVACGLGDIGNYFRTTHNCSITFTEGRKEYLPIIRSKNPNSEIHQLNHEENWNLNKKFDIVINFGLLYHLYNWKQDLICSLNHTDILVLETEVADSDKPFFEYEFTDRNDYDQSITETRRVKRVSANHIEHVLEENNFSFVRYDDEDLNSTMHIYDWKVSGSSEKENLDPNNDTGRRRFWIAKRK